MKRITLLTLCIGFAVAGCKEDELAAPTGTYEITSHTRTEMTCDGDGAEVMETEFFSLEIDDVFGFSILGWHDCASAESCEEASSLLRSFMERDGRWVLESTQAGGIDDCQGSISEGSLEETADGVHIEIRTLSGLIELEDGEECGTDLIDAHRDELECTSLELIDGRSV